MKHNPLISSKFLLETPWTDGLYMFTAWQKCGIHKTVTNFTSFCSGGFCKITCTSCTAPLPGIFGRLYNVTTVTWDPQKIPRILVSKNIFGCWRWFIIVDPTQNSENIVVSYLHEAGSRGFSRPQLWRLVVPCCTHRRAATISGTHVLEETEPSFTASYRHIKRIIPRMGSF